MSKIELATILYSNKNFDLGYRLHRCCLKMCMNLVNCINFVDLTIKTIQIKPQIIFFDMTTIDINSLQLRALLDSGEYRHVKLVFIGNDDLKRKIDNLELKQIDFCDINAIEYYLFNCMDILKLNAFSAMKEEKQHHELSSIVAQMLFSLGFSPKHMGYCYLKEIIKQVVIDGGVLSSLVSDQYPFIAVKYKTTIWNIERNIRNAITLAFKNCNGSEWDNFFSVCACLEQNRRPTNREFISMCVDILLSKYPKKASLSN